MEMTRERITFTFGPRELLLYLQMVFSNFIAGRPEAALLLGSSCFFLYQFVCDLLALDMIRSRKML